jgi:hypothetical protein
MKTMMRRIWRWWWTRRGYRRCRRGDATAREGEACTTLFLGSAAISAGTLAISRHYEHVVGRVYDRFYALVALLRGISVFVQVVEKNRSSVTEGRRNCAARRTASAAGKVI